MIGQSQEARDEALRKKAAEEEKKKVVVEDSKWSKEDI